MKKIVNVEYTKALYNEKSAWPTKNIWHEYTFCKLSSTIEKYFSQFINEKSKILNIGSGGTSYNLKGTLFHLDIADELIKNLDNAFVGTAEKIPFDEESFDDIICVGSVLNYCNAMSVISESSRVLKPNGYMILEFERSNSGEFIFTSKYNSSVFPNWYIYNNQNHMLWMYSENYITNLLEVYGFKIIKKFRFHCLTALANRFIELNDRILSSLLKVDKYFTPISKNIAHNVIIVCQKTD